MPAVTKETLQDEKQCEEILEDIILELSKFGRIRSTQLPRPNDMLRNKAIKESALGKAFVEFEEIASAFACYNLLNNRPFLGKPVEIDFY